MSTDNSLTIYPDEGNGPYIVLKDGSKRYFNNLYEAMEGLCEEYPIEDYDEDEYS